jgi:hypothetical protein
MGLIALLKHRLHPRTIAKEVDAGVVRLASQGSAELAQALYTGQAFVPYGPTDRPLPVEAPDYGARLDQMSARMPNKSQGQDRGIDR